METSEIGSTRMGATGTRRMLALGIGSAWALVALYVIYAGVLVAGGVLRGTPEDPWLGIAEVLCIVCGPLQVALLVAIHEGAPTRVRTLTRMAVLWMLVMASLTMTVHFVQLTVGRGIDLAGSPELARVFGWEWPSLLYAVELAAWHLFFGLSMLFAAAAFPGHGSQANIRFGLRAIGALCLVGLVGPATGNLSWRMMGVFGYALLFPIVCALIARFFTQAHARQSEVSHG